MDRPSPANDTLGPHAYAEGLARRATEPHTSLTGWPTAVEAEFQSTYLRLSAQRIRTGCLIGAALLTTFALWDFLSFPEELAGVSIPLRLGLAVPLLLTAAHAARPGRAHPSERLPFLVWMAALAAGAVVTLITAAGRGHGLSIHGGGMLLVAFATWSVTGLRARIVAPVAALNIGLFVATQIAFGSSLTGLLEETAFLVMANLLGGFDSLVRERAARLNFLHERRLEGLAMRDGLTSLPNRRAFDLHLHRVLRHSRRMNQSVALLIVDVDFFKRYNDALGHLEGDECLRRVGTALAGVMRRPFDMAARFGGEEFALIAPDTDGQGAQVLGERIHAAIADLAMAHPDSPVDSHLTISIGAVAGAVGDLVETLDLIEQADSALYAAKNDGRSRSVVREIDAGAPHTSAPLVPLAAPA